MRSFLALIVFVFGLQAYALPESELATIKDILNNDSDSVNLQYGSFLGQDDILVGYLRVGFNKGANGSIVIVPGRAEVSLQYMELAIDFMNAGYEPIYIMDPRGQGFSERELKDTQKGHVTKFENYSDDLNVFSTIASQDPKMDKKNLFLVSHSMGGAISTDYLEKYTSVYKAAIMIAPMHMIFTPDGEASTLTQTWQACYIPFGPSCSDYIPNGGPYVALPLSKGSTLSKARYEFGQWVKKTWPETKLGSPTIKWVRESVKANQNMRKQVNVQKIKTPFLLLQSGKDTTVDNKGQNEVCSYTKLCTKIRFKNAEHSMHNEKDAVRDVVLKTMLDFLAKY